MFDASTIELWFMKSLVAHASLSAHKPTSNPSSRSQPNGFWHAVVLSLAPKSYQICRIFWRERCCSLNIKHDRRIIASPNMCRACSRGSLHGTHCQACTNESVKDTRKNLETSKHYSCAIVTGREKFKITFNRVVHLLSNIQTHCTNFGYERPEKSGIS